MIYFKQGERRKKERKIVRRKYLEILAKNTLLKCNLDYISVYIRTIYRKRRREKESIRDMENWKKERTKETTWSNNYVCAMDRTCRSFRDRSTLNILGPQGSRSFSRTNEKVIQESERKRIRESSDENLFRTKQPTESLLLGLIKIRDRLHA